MSQIELYNLFLSSLINDLIKESCRVNTMNFSPVQVYVHKTYPSVPLNNRQDNRFTHQRSNHQRRH